MQVQGCEPRSGDFWLSVSRGCVLFKLDLRLKPPMDHSCPSESVFRSLFRLA